MKSLLFVLTLLGGGTAWAQSYEPAVEAPRDARTEPGIVEGETEPAAPVMKKETRSERRRRLRRERAAEKSVAEPEKTRRMDPARTNASELPLKETTPGTLDRSGRVLNETYEPAKE
jgi:hypothetical protein